MAKTGTRWVCRECGKEFRFHDGNNDSIRPCPRCGQKLQKLERRRRRRKPDASRDQINSASTTDQPLRPRKRKRKEVASPGPAAWHPLLNRFQIIREHISTRARERSPFVLILVLVLTTSLALDTLADSGFIPMLFSALSWMDFVIHELGHLATRLLGQTISVAAGTIVQLAIPFGAIIMFRRQRDDAAACFAATWLTLSMMHSADYIADARAQAGDMSTSASFWTLTSGQTVRPNDLVHDWNYMLGGIGLLQWDQQLAATVRILAGAIAVVAVIANAYMAWVSMRSSRQTDHS